jgi:hypothetical protein
VDRPRQALGLPQVMAVRQHRANQICIVCGEENIECKHGRNAAVDRAGFEASFGLDGDEMVYVAMSDLFGIAIPDDLDELVQVIAIIPPGARLWIAAVHPIDEPFDFEYHTKASCEAEYWTGIHILLAGGILPPQLSGTRLR